MLPRPERCLDLFEAHFAKVTGRSIMDRMAGLLAHQPDKMWA
jgi:hypothetical protein